MRYGICNLSIVPIRIEPSDSSEMISQLLFGEHFKLLEIRKNWSKIRVDFDNYEGWVDNKQFEEITEEFYLKINNNSLCYANELIEFATYEKGNYITLTLGSSLPLYSNRTLLINTTSFEYEGNVITTRQSKNDIVNTAFKYLNTPYLSGGKTPFGIDCSGFTQMVYKLCGYKLLRDARQQATQGEALSFIEESEPGDLAFFDNNEGIIIHVGIIMKDNYIIHAHGKIRVDRIDHSGIFNINTKKHTHKLRVIKKII
jgi:hypothetical protein